MVRLMNFVCLLYHILFVYFATFCLFTLPHFVCLLYHILFVYFTTFCLFTLPHFVCLLYHILFVYFTTFCLFTLPHFVCLLYHILFVHFTTFCLFTLPHFVCLLYHISISFYGLIIQLIKTTAAQNENALCYYRVRGLYFLAVVFVTNINEKLSSGAFNYYIIINISNKICIRYDMKV